MRWPVTLGSREIERKYSDKDNKAEMASMFAKERGEAELKVNFRSLEEKSKRGVVATAVTKTLSKREAYARLKNRTYHVQQPYMIHII